MILVQMILEEIKSIVAAIVLEFMHNSMYNEIMFGWLSVWLSFHKIRKP